MTQEASVLNNDIKNIPGSVYVHIPFCVAKCCYCDFNSFAGCQSLYDPYVQAVCVESEAFWFERSIPLQMPQQVLRTLYIGGGTPTILSAEQIGRIARSAAPVELRDPNIEFTVEANPGTVTIDQLRQLLSLGVNRLSLGVQSLDDRMLAWLGRIHTAEQARETIASVRGVGFDNINLDFIFGLPSQTLGEWQQTLQQALALGADHLSLYALTVEEGTPLASRIERGEVSLPDEDLVANMYQLAEDLLETAGYLHYELSNWAKPTKESRHNLAYWANVSYVGFGAGAHSYLSGHRLANQGDPRTYITNIGQNRLARESDECITSDLEMAETAFLGLRRSKGLSRDEFFQRFGRELDFQYGDAIDDLHRLGLLVVDEEGIRLTRRGRLLGNEVFVRFLP